MVESNELKTGVIAIQSTMNVSNGFASTLQALIAQLTHITNNTRS